MTRYEQGFLTKCAEYGLGIGESTALLELAKSAGLTPGVGNVAARSQGHPLPRALGQQPVAPAPAPAPAPAQPPPPVR